MEQKPEIRGNVVDLSSLAKTPGEKGEAAAIKFMSETREALVVIMEQQILFDQGMEDAYKAIQYLTAKVRELEKELKILKGRDLDDGKESGQESDSTGENNTENFDNGEAPAGGETGSKGIDRPKH